MIVYLATYDFVEDSDHKRDVYLIGIYTTEDLAKKGIEQTQKAMGKNAKYYGFGYEPIILDETETDYYSI
jgi:hypothetical protein